MLRPCIHYGFHFGFEMLIEIFHCSVPFCLSLRDFIELLFYFCCEIVVHNVWEVLHEEVVYHDANVGWNKFSLIGTCHFLLVLRSNLQCL